MAGLWILLATGVLQSCRGWVAGQPRVVLGPPLVTNVNFTSNEKIFLTLDCNS